MADPCVVDTMVLQKANAPIGEQRKTGRDFGKRIALLRSIKDGKIKVLISAKLLAEYQSHVTTPRNEVIRSFLELLTKSGTARWNYAKPWSGAQREKMSRCRFPNEDEHVLRTAVLDGEGSTILTEEGRMLRTDACIHRSFDVHVKNPLL